MYATCLHCHASLGANEEIEHFPVGARLAFDAGKGRLRVVCPGCRRWNLTPLEERWEAIEECERAYRQTRFRASRDSIAVARTRSGMGLVRIGAPELREMAAWRYGTSLGRRWTTRGLPLAAAGLLALATASAFFSAWQTTRAAFRRRVREYRLEQALRHDDSSPQLVQARADANA